MLLVDDRVASLRRTVGLLGTLSFLSNHSMMSAQVRKLATWCIVSCAGDPDVIVAAVNLGVVWYANNGDGVFLVAAEVLQATVDGGAEYYSDVKLGDLDGDGALDAVWRYYVAVRDTAIAVMIAD